MVRAAKECFEYPLKWWFHASASSRRKWRWKWKSISKWSFWLRKIFGHGSNEQNKIDDVPPTVICEWQQIKRPKRMKIKTETPKQTLKHKRKQTSNHITISNSRRSSSSHSSNNEPINLTHFVPTKPHTKHTLLGYWNSSSLLAAVMDDCLFCCLTTTPENETQSCRSLFYVIDWLILLAVWQSFFVVAWNQHFSS